MNRVAQMNYFFSSKAGWNEGVQVDESTGEVRVVADEKHFDSYMERSGPKASMQVSIHGRQAAATS